MEALLLILLAFVILFVLWILVQKFVTDGTIRMVIGLLLGIIFLVYALRQLGVLSGGSLNLN